MSFIADKQTLDDLNLLGKYKPNSIFSMFNHTRTSGGEKLLEHMFLHPLSKPEEINQRSDIFQYFQNKALTFPFDGVQFAIMESYLTGGAETNILFAGIGNLKKQILALAVRDEQYATMQTGVKNTITILDTCREFINGLDGQNPGNLYTEQIEQIKGYFNDKRLCRIIEENNTGHLSFLKLTRYDYLLKHTLQKQLSAIMQVVYHLDVYIAVANVAQSKNFCFAKALSKENNCFNSKNLYHPSINKAIGNSISLQHQSNMLFLTGANMAGKSTLMKTFGISVYLAHMGFPIAAKSMEFSVKDGIFSSINVPDNLNKGYSHFYAEVLRVKTVAEAVSNGKDMIVIFDELFKGTNVKDAYDATLGVTEAFAAYRNCFFIISTHIIEVGDSLQERCANIRFSYLPTIMEGSIPRYPYKLENGITTYRQGMIIIENEGILEILRDKTPVE